MTIISLLFFTLLLTSYLALRVAATLALRAGLSSTL